MTWKNDAPLDALNEAAFVYFEMRGYDGYHAWLEQELSRVRVVMGIRSGRRDRGAVLDPIAREPDFESLPEAARNAIRFYADDTNWQRPGGGRGRPAAHLDEGEIARKAIAQLEGQETSDDETSDDD